MAPDLGPVEDGGKEALALSRGPLGDDGRAGVEQSDEPGADIGRTGSLALFLEQQLLDGARPATTALDRPVHTGVASLEEQGLPALVIGTTTGPISGLRLRRQRRENLGQPSPKISAEGFLGVGVAQVHSRSAVEVEAEQ